MNMVPLGPITMVRPPGWPDDQISALKPGGSFNLSTGIFSIAVTVGGVGCGASPVSCLLAAGLDLSMALKPGGPAGAAGVADGVGAGAGAAEGAGAGAAGCCPIAGTAADRNATVPASKTLRLPSMRRPP